VQVTAFVIAEQQRAESLAAAARFGPAADDELLALARLDLTHSRERVERLGRRSHLADDPFETAPLGEGEQFFPVPMTCLEYITP